MWTSVRVCVPSLESKVTWCIVRGVVVRPQGHWSLICDSLLRILSGNFLFPLPFLFSTLFSSPSLHLSFLSSLPWFFFFLKISAVHLSYNVLFIFYFSCNCGSTHSPFPHPRNWTWRLLSLKETSEGYFILSWGDIFLKFAVLAELTIKANVFHF